jgi:hypothetical protein
MLPTFRSMLVAVVTVVVAVMVLGRGLVPAPEAVTRIGEVPVLGRTLVRLSQVPLDDAQRLLLTAAALRTALADAAETSSGVTAFAPVAEPGARSADGGAAAPTLPLVAADERSRTVVPPKAPSADPLGDLIRALIPETPEPAPRETTVADEAPLPAEHGHILTTAIPATEPPAGPAAEPPDTSALGFAAEPARPRIVLPVGTEPDPAPAPAEATAPLTPIEVAARPAAVDPPSSGPVVAAVTPPAPGAVTAPPPTAKAAPSKAKRATKPAIRKKVRTRTTSHRTVARSAPAPAAQAPSVVYPSYSPFGGPVQAIQPGVQTTVAPAGVTRR